MNKKESCVIIIVLIIVVMTIFSIVDFLIWERYINIELEKTFRNILWAFFTIFSAITGFILIKRGEQQEEISRRIYDGFGFFSLGLSGNRLFFVFNDLGIMATDLAKDQSTLIGYSIALLSSLALINMMEKNVFHEERQIFSKIILILAIISGLIAILGFFIEEISLLTNIVRNIIMVVAISASIIIILLYLKIIRKSTGIVRKKMIGVFFGIVFIFIGAIFDGALIKSLLTYPDWIAPIFSILGILFILYYQLRVIT